MMNPLTRSAYAADVRHLVQFFGIDGVLECDTPAEWARIEHALTVRDSRTPDEALALQIVRASPIYCEKKASSHDHHSRARPRRASSDR